MEGQFEERIGSTFNTFQMISSCDLESFKSVSTPPANNKYIFNLINHYKIPVFCSRSYVQTTKKVPDMVI